MSIATGRLSWSIIGVALISLAGALTFGLVQSSSSMLSDVARWSHIGLAVLWVSSTAVGSGALLPIWRKQGGESATTMTSRYARAMTITVLGIVGSGILLSFAVLADGSTSWLWGGLLLSKIALSVALFYVAIKKPTILEDTNRGVMAKATRLLGYDALLLLGVVALLVTSLFRFI